eukprot:TRINITY_DN70325_c0_g1_i1.p1 TRINITY_DN70325_c0_g1~~TRINITY_DN70325_c0_g1_i1.p1  ORF type:complete len:382 (+),score=102.66 TRINITY_DN70325_c0_g1_i1:84-1229(+)
MPPDDEPVAPFVYSWVDAKTELPDCADGAEDDATAAAPTTLRAMSLNILADGLASGSPTAPDVEVPCPPAFETDRLAVGVAEVPLPEGGAAGETQRFKFRCESSLLVWERRWAMLKSMILAQEPDLIGLQEVDLYEGAYEGSTNHWKEMKEEMAAVGYTGACARKRGRACDGVALFWRKSRLKAVGNPEMQPLAGTVHVALVQQLILDDAHRVTAVSTHLKAGLTPDAEMIRYKQAESLLKYLKGRRDVVLMADLNANCRPFLAPLSECPAGTMVHPKAYPTLTRSLRSVYQSVLGEEPPFTSWGGWVGRDVRGVFDYILLRSDVMAPRRVLQLPEASEIVRFAERLPNRAHPSDHLPLAVDLIVVPPPDSKKKPRKRQKS